MSKLKKNWRCIVDLKGVTPATRGRAPIEYCNRVIIIIQAEKPGQAEGIIYEIFDGAVSIPYLVGTPREMTGTEQMQLFTV